MLILPGPPPPNTSVPVVPGQDPLPFWSTDNVAAVLEDGQVFLQSGRIARRSGSAQLRAGEPVMTLSAPGGGLVAHAHAVRRADFSAPPPAVLQGGLEGLVLLTRAGVREIWFTDGQGASKIKFPGARAAQFTAATSATVPVWGQRDDSFFLILDEFLPTEKTWVVTLKRLSPGAAMSRPAVVTKLVELPTTSFVSPPWFVPGGAWTGDIDVVSGPYLDATNHLVICVGSLLAGAGALLDLTAQTVLLTVTGSSFGPPTFASDSFSFVALTILHLNRGAPKQSRIVAMVTGQGRDGGGGFHSSDGLSIIDGEGAIVMNQVAPFSEVGGIIVPGTSLTSTFTTVPSRRHFTWARADVGPFESAVYMTDVYGKTTVSLGLSTIDGFGVWHPAVDPNVLLIRPDFALRNANSAAPYFVKWWNKSTGAILLSNPLTDVMLQTEDPDLKGRKKKLTAIPAGGVGPQYAYHVVEGSRFFPYLTNRKNP